MNGEERIDGMTSYGETLSRSVVSNIDSSPSPIFAIILLERWHLRMGGLCCAHCFVVCSKQKGNSASIKQK